MARLIQTRYPFIARATVSAFSLAQPPSSSGIKTCAIGSTGVMNVENPVDVGGAIKFNDLAGASFHWDGKTLMTVAHMISKVFFAKMDKNICSLTCAVPASSR